MVLLGAGMDSRPWRLDLPPGVAWFEVDRQDVLEAKTSTLQRHGVQVDAMVSALGRSTHACIVCQLAGCEYAE